MYVSVCIFVRVPNVHSCKLVCTHYSVCVCFCLEVCVAFTFLAYTHVCVLTRQVTAKDLHPHADPSRRPPLRKDSDVLSHYLIKPPHLWSVIVAISFENLRAHVDSNVISVQRVLTVLSYFHFKTGKNKDETFPLPHK